MHKNLLKKQKYIKHKLSAVLDEKHLLVRFYSEASAIAPGQSAVFYDGRRVLGGAFIASQRGIRKIAADNQDKL